MSAETTQLLTDTIAVHMKILRDQFHVNNRFLERVMTKKKIRPGGLAIKQPIGYDKLDNAGAINPYSPHSITNNEKRRESEFDWATYQASIELFKFDILINQGGPTRILDMIADEFKSASLSLNDAVSANIFSGTGIQTGTGVRQLVGLATAIDATAAYGGVDPATITQWASTETAATTLTLGAMSTMLRTITIGNRKPTVIMTTDDASVIYENLLLPIQTISDANRGNSGFADLAYHGIPVLEDKGCTSGVMYFINEDTIHYEVLKGADMFMKAKQEPDNQFSEVQSILYAPCFWIDERRLNGKLTGIAA
jgi:hypothetical protein